MKHIQNSLMNFFNYIAYLCFLNMLWIFSTLAGGILFGIGPATYALIYSVHQFRSKQNYTSIRIFFERYKEHFWLSNLYFGLGGIFFITSLFNLRISIVFFNSYPFLQAIYLLLIFIVATTALLFFHNYTMNPSISIMQNLRVTLFLLFRYPLNTLAFIFTFITLFFLFTNKTSLLILFGAALLILFFDYYHSSLVIKFHQINEPIS